MSLLRSYNDFVNYESVSRHGTLKPLIIHSVKAKIMVEAGDSDLNI